MEEIDFLKRGGGATFYFFFQKPFLAHFSITFLSAIQVLVWYKKSIILFCRHKGLLTLRSSTILIYIFILSICLKYFFFPYLIIYFSSLLTYFDDLPIYYYYIFLLSTYIYIFIYLSIYLIHSYIFLIYLSHIYFSWISQLLAIYFLLNPFVPNETFQVIWDKIIPTVFQVGTNLSQ